MGSDTLPRVYIGTVVAVCDYWLANQPKGVDDLDDCNKAGWPERIDHALLSRIVFPGTSPTLASANRSPNVTFQSGAFPKLNAAFYIDWRYDRRFGPHASLRRR